PIPLSLSEQLECAGLATNLRLQPRRHGAMRKHLTGLLLAGAIAIPFITTACPGHHYYRAYDPYYHDYHRWDDHETVYYQRWTVETHRDSHRDYRNLSKNEQQEYWTWRHNHHD